MSAPSFNLVGPMVQQQITHILYILVNVVFPTIERTFHQLQRGVTGVRQPYHTSILSGQAWVQELLHGHPRRIHTELGVHEHVFRQLIFCLHHMGHGDSKYITLEEQLAIFLYTCVTGLTSPHVGERFQHTGETISKYVGPFLVNVECTLNIYLIIQFSICSLADTFGRWLPYSLLVHSTQNMSSNPQLLLHHIFETIRSCGHF